MLPVSTYTFADQLLGLAREYKKGLKRIERNCSRNKVCNLPYFDAYQMDFRRNMKNAMDGNGYWKSHDVDNFCEALEELIENSTPEYRYKGKSGAKGIS